MDYIESARRVISMEIAEIERLSERISTPFREAIDLLLETIGNKGKIVIIGVGKSGNIGQKIAATFNSTGATAVVLSTQDALHGDLGVVKDGDVIVALSQSGETQDINNILPYLKRFSVRIISFTGSPNSTLGKNSDIVLDTNIEKEACPLNLAPTSSTSVMLVLGDALAMVLLEARGFKSEDFAKLHPGGAIGRILLTKVTDIMRTGEDLALISATTRVNEALHAMTKKRSGAALIVDSENRLEGIFTQGDFVRAFQAEPGIGSRAVSAFMTRTPISIQKNKLAAEVLQVLQENRIDDLVVVDPGNRVVGLVDSQDLSRLKLI